MLTATSDVRSQIEASLANCPELSVLLDPAGAAEFGSFVASVGEQFRRRGSISDRQRDAVLRIVARPEPLKPGIYESPDGEVFKVQKSRGSTNLYAKVLIINENVRRLTEAGEVVRARYEYESGAIRQVQSSWRVSLDRAKELGHLTATCIVCGAHLEDAVSVAEGIGPVCAGRV